MLSRFKEEPHVALESIREKDDLKLKRINWKEHLSLI